MDPEENMKIAEKQFARACEELGFRGNIVCLWRHLDKDNCGSVSLVEMDSSSAVLLVEFKALLHQQFGGKVAKFMQFADDNKSNRVFKEEWCLAFQKLNFQGSPKRLFELLCRYNCGAISLKDLLFLEKWSPPVYLFVKGNKRMYTEMMQVLRETHDNMLLAWFKVFDPDQIMRVSWAKFKQACVKISRSAQPGQIQNLPKTEEDMAAVWRVMDEDCSGWISLREVDRFAYEATGSFKRWADARHGGILRLLHSPKFELVYGAGKLINKNNLRKVLKEADFEKEVADLLLNGLDISEQGQLGENDMKCLDKWDLVWEEWEANAHREDGVITASESQAKAKANRQISRSPSSATSSP